MDGKVRESATAALAAVADLAEAAEEAASAANWMVAVSEELMAARIDAAIEAASILLRRAYAARKAVHAACDAVCASGVGDRDVVLQDVAVSTFSRCAAEAAHSVRLAVRKAHAAHRYLAQIRRDLGRAHVTVTWAWAREAAHAANVAAGRAGAASIIQWLLED